MTLPLVGWFALILPVAYPQGGPTGDKDKVDAVTMTGKVVELTAVLKSAAVACDTEPIARQVVLQEPDGTISPLLSDEASRALFLDARLRDRRVELHARRHPGLPYLQVVSFKVDDHGHLRTPEYFCDICTISVRYPQICPCCQGPMVLRMKPGDD
jgi:hypothetical protein